MSARRYHLDSNILLRFLTATPKEQSEAAVALIAEAQAGEVQLELSPLVLAETLFTLESFYRTPRKEAAGVLLEFVNRLGVRLAEKDVMLDALRRVQTTGVHLVDGYLAALAADTQIPVASFDRDFDRFKDVERHEPQKP